MHLLILPNHFSQPKSQFNIIFFPVLIGKWNFLIIIMNSIYFSHYLPTSHYFETGSYNPLQTSTRRQPRELDFRIKYKTEICRNWELGLCGFGENCAFAHGYEELRNRINLGNNYKTKKCKQFHEQGYCIYGNRCQFKHRDSSEETTASSPNWSQTPSRKSSDDSNKRRLPIFVDIEKKGDCLA
jgi:hypothetical protein